MRFPTPHTVYWHRAVPGAADERGNPTITYDPALNEQGAEVRVIAWWPIREQETTEVRVESDYWMAVPPTVEVTPQDVVDLPIGRFEVEGHPQDYNHGPFGHTPGCIVKLKRVES